MKTLTIFYDPHCGLCAEFRAWLENQPKRVHTEFLGYDSAEALARFPELRLMGADKEVVVMADDGRWWQGASAWVTCLWATHAYHEWAFRLASPASQPLVKKVVRLLSENRLTLSRLMRLRSDEALAEAVESLPDPGCSDGTCKIPITPSTLIS